MSSDEALMLEFQRGSREAFAELFDRYHGPLYGFFRRRLAGRDDDARAEDLAQETFLAVIRAGSRYEPRSLVRTYLYGIALKLLAQERRRRAKDSPAPETSKEPAQDTPSDTILWVRQALEKLDSIDREVLMLREYEQLSYSDIAQLLRLPVNTVRSRLFRARMALKECLEPEPRTEAGSTGSTRWRHDQPGQERAGKRSPKEGAKDDGEKKAVVTKLRAGEEGISQ